MRASKSDGKTKLGIVGAGLMGHALAQLFAMQGHPVALFDNNHAVLESAPDRIRNNFRTFLELGLAVPEDVELCLGLISLCTEFARCRTGLGDHHRGCQREASLKAEDILGN